MPPSGSSDQLSHPPLPVTAQTTDKISEKAQHSNEHSSSATGRDTGTLSQEWSQELLSRYSSQLALLDDKEESLLHRLAAIQKLQMLWSTAGRQSEMDRSDKRIKTQTTKVLLEDDRLSIKRRKLENVISAVQNLVGMLDGNEKTLQSETNS